MPPFFDTRRNYQLIDEFFQNDLRVMLYKAPPDYYSVHLIRTTSTNKYSACIVKITSTEDWEKTFTILSQLKAERHNTPYYSIKTGKGAAIRIQSFRLLGKADDTPSYVTTITRGSIVRGEDESFSSIPSVRQSNKDGDKEETHYSNKRRRRNDNEDGSRKTDSDENSDDYETNLKQRAHNQQHRYDNDNHNSVQRHESTNKRRSRSRTPTKSHSTYNLRNRRTLSSNYYQPSSSDEPQQPKLSPETQTVVLEDKHVDFLIDNVCLAKLRPSYKKA